LSDETSPNAIRWPERFAPGRAPVHVRNELSMAVPAERAWQWLVRATIWPTWYTNSQDVRITRGVGPDLAAGTEFHWRTFGVAIRSTVEECEPPRRLAWSAHGFGVEAYHAWLITPTSTGCTVLTEETQYGAMARLGSLTMPKRMYDYHQIWLEALRDRAAEGPPPGEAAEAESKRKAYRPGYDETPFFYEETFAKGTRVVAWDGRAAGQKRLFYALLGTFGETIDYLFKAAGDGVPEGPPNAAPDAAWRHISGGILKSDLLALIGARESWFFADSHFQLCLRQHGEDGYFAYDEHGLFFLYAMSDVDRLLTPMGLAKRRRELVSEGGHWAIRPAASAAELASFKRELKTKSQFYKDESERPADAADAADAAGATEAASGSPSVD
jgi:uncharacterized protein YndB with AHSA1/START domain